METNLDGANRNGTGLDWLKRTRDRKMTQREAAERMGVSERWVCKLLRRMKKQGDAAVVKNRIHRIWLISIMSTPQEPPHPDPDPLPFPVRDPDEPEHGVEDPPPVPLPS